MHEIIRDTSFIHCHYYLLLMTIYGTLYFVDTRKYQLKQIYIIICNIFV